MGTLLLSSDYQVRSFACTARPSCGAVKEKRRDLPQTAPVQGAS
jgi:hypothetical protein